MQFERKREIMDNLLLFAQKESLNEKQKKAFLKIVKELPKGTNLQKERFIMYFGLDKTKGKRKKICESYLQRMSNVQAGNVSTLNKRTDGTMYEVYLLWRINTRCVAKFR